MFQFTIFLFSFKCPVARPTSQVMPVLWSVFILTVGNPLTFWNTMQHPLHLGGFSANTDTFHCYCNYFHQLNCGLTYDFW